MKIMFHGQNVKHVCHDRTVTACSKRRLHAEMKGAELTRIAFALSRYPNGTHEPTAVRAGEMSTFCRPGIVPFISDVADSSAQPTNFPPNESYPVYGRAHSTPVL